MGDMLLAYFVGCWVGAATMGWVIRTSIEKKVTEFLIGLTWHVETSEGHQFTITAPPEPVDN